MRFVYDLGICAVARCRGLGHLLFHLTTGSHPFHGFAPVALFLSLATRAQRPRVEIDEINRFILDVIPQDHQIVAVIKGVHGKQENHPVTEAVPPLLETGGERAAMIAETR